MTGSWDQTVKFWDMRQSQPVHQVQVGVGALLAASLTLRLPTYLLCFSLNVLKKALMVLSRPLPPLKPSLQLPHKVYAMDCRYPYLAVATSNKDIHVYNLAGGVRPYKVCQLTLP